MTSATKESPPRVLVVGDQQDDFIIVRGFVEQESVMAWTRSPVVSWAAGYHDGLAALLDSEFDVLLVDYELSGGSVFEFLDEAEKRGNRAPVIVLAGRQDTHRGPDAIERGLADFLDKGSLSADTLTRSIRHSLERSRIGAKWRIADAENRRILESARCLFMTCEVTERSNRLVWEAEIRNVDMAQQILPLAIPEGSTYAEAFYFAQVDEDRLTSSTIAADAVRASRPDFQLQYRVRNSHGEIRWLSEDTKIEVLGPGRWRLTGVCIDITERKRSDDAARYVERQMTAIVRNALDAVIVMNQAGIVTEFNPAAEDIFGYLREHALGEPVAELIIPSAQRADHRQGLARYLETGEGPVINNRLELVAMRADQSEFPVEIAVTNVRLGEEVLFIGFIRDITERVLAETQIRAQAESLRRANEELEQRVADRTADLQHAKQMADRANLAKSEFLSRMSHELRTPLNAILGFGQVLERQSLDPINEESVKYILKGGRHLLHLINEVLDLARVESGHIDVSIEPVEVRPLLRECVDLARTLAEERHVSLVLDDDGQNAPVVLADQRRLKQVFLNLLSNGIKYNSARGKVTISCRSSTDGRIRINFKDSGKGIRSEDLPKLFTPFQRLDADSTAIEGTGLGLSLSHRLVTLMAGQIEVESTPGAGSTFSVILPQAAAAAVTELGLTGNAIDIGPSHRSDLKSTVLCIEDNPLNLRLFQTIFLTRPNITLITATQGLAGLDIAARIRPNLVLLDLNLPDTSGLEILREMRGMKELEGIPIIVVSADATKGQIANLLASGADRYLTKPVDVAELLSTVDTALESRNSENKQ